MYEVEEFFDKIGCIDVTDLMNWKRVTKLEQVWELDSTYWEY